MRPDFNKDVDVLGQHTFDGLLEHDRLADIMPPVFRVKFRPIQQGAGNGRVKGCAGFARL